MIKTNLKEKEPIPYIILYMEFINKHPKISNMYINNKNVELYTHHGIFNLEHYNSFMDIVNAVKIWGIN